MNSDTPPDILLQNREIAKLNDLRPKAEYVYEPAPGGSVRKVANQAEFDKKNAEIDAMIAAVPAERAQARVEASERFRAHFQIGAAKSDLRQAFWRAADRDR